MVQAVNRGCHFGRDWNRRIEVEVHATFLHCSYSSAPRSI